MKLTELFRLVFINIMSNKAKGMLTSLGIIVGSATIVLVIAIGQGGKLDVADQFKNLNAGAIEITSGMSADTMMEQFMGGSNRGGAMPDMGGGGMPSGNSFGGGNMPSGGGFGGRNPSGGNVGGRNSRSGGFGGNMVSKGETLTADDVEDILTLVPNVESASLLVSGKGLVSGGDLEEETEYTMAGVQPEYMHISNLEIQYGDFLTSMTLRTTARSLCLDIRPHRKFSVRHILRQVKSLQ